MTQADYLAEAKELGKSYAQMFEQKRNYELFVKNIPLCKNEAELKRNLRAIQVCKSIYNFEKTILEQKGEKFSPLEAELNYRELLN